MDPVLVRSFAFLLALIAFQCSEGLRKSRPKFGWWRGWPKGKLEENECRYTTSKVSYRIKHLRSSTKCHRVSIACLNPNYPPFVRCSIVRCSLTKKSVPYRRLTGRQSKIVCCPGWKKNESSNDPGCTLETCNSLPQFTPSACLNPRLGKLQLNRAIYRFTNPPDSPPDAEITNENAVQFFKNPLLNLTLNQVVGLASQKPHEKQWVNVYFGLTEIVRGITANTLRSGRFNNLEDFSDYDELIDHFQEGLNGSQVSQFVGFPSNEEDFKDIVTDEVWQSDHVFADQRLAGQNPLSIRKLRLKEYIERRSQFNPVLDKEVEIISKERTDMLEMVKKGLVYILDYPLMNNVITMSDITDLNPNDERQLKSQTSPIAIFVSLIDSFSGKRELKPLAIQTDFTASSPVFTPRDGTKWLLAKEVVQRADIQYVQVVEHLLKTHFLLGSVCISIQRHISEYHPLYNVFIYHCRGVLVTNSAALPALLYPDGLLRQLFTIGHVGSIDIMNNAFLTMTWDDANFVTALRKRGVNDASKLPYFPYRDDGLILWRMVKEFSRELVDLYYHNTKNVLEDKELQNFANELSDKGTGTDGGKGMVKDFPNKIKSKRQLAETLARIFFIPIQHSAVNYPASYYSAFAPNMPTKLYDDPRGAPEEFSIHSLPLGHVATTMVGLAMNLAALRFDNLFDYHPDLQDKNAAQLVARYFNYLNGPVLKELKSRNEHRLRAGHLTYPYFLPGWLPNSIHT